ncbi:MAG: hypothetical protein IPP19_14420 [Verrucomicrobia bacterium]|nr:hypothetical protein [Verrucomicrobiota bacterium]
MEDFYTQFDRVLRAAFHYGETSVPLRSDVKNPFTDITHLRKFTAACHRGFEKAQNSVLEMLKANAADLSLSGYERRRRELLLRKVIDGIIFMMLRAQTYVTRRISLHDAPPNLDFGVIDRAMVEVKRLNAEDRLTFAALADLSTFVHICDVVRINRRDGGHGLSFIELKEGRVNAIVAKHLEKYAATPEALDQIKVDAEIAPEHRKQAQRMQKQRIRFSQTAKVLRDDEGTDIKSNQPIRMNHQIINEVHYYKQFDEAARVALESGVSSITVNYCLHIGMASGGDLRDRIRRARRAAAYGFAETATKSEGGLKSFYKKIQDMGIEGGEAFRITNLIHSHLMCVPASPLFSWGVSKEAIDAIVRDELSIYCVLDLPAMMFAIERAGLIPELATGAEAEKAASFGMGPPRFGGRALKIKHPELPGADILLGGAFSRFINNLHSPYHYFLTSKEHWAEMHQDRAGQAPSAEDASG